MIIKKNYHHHIITREDNELIKKVYMKQKESPVKGDWIHSLRNDYEFVGETIDNMEDCITNTNKDVFSKTIKYKIYDAAFKSYLEMK